MDMLKKDCERSAGSEVQCFQDLKVKALGVDMEQVKLPDVISRQDLIQGAHLDLAFHNVWREHAIKVSQDMLLIKRTDLIILKGQSRDMFRGVLRHIVKAGCTCRPDCDLL